MARWRQREEPVSTEIDPKKNYTNGELAAIADALLREDARSEICRECGVRGQQTGNARREAQPQEGGMLIIEFKEFVCQNRHTWFQGEGATRGIGGDNPILFEEHILQRRKREIFCNEGTPDPNIVSGIYNRVHPGGRKVNSPEQRAKHGASFYR